MDRPPAWAPPARPPLPIRTARLLLDGHADADAPALYRAIDEHREALVPWLPWAAADHRDEAESLARIRSFAEARGYAHPENLALGVFDPERSEVLGGTGLHAIDADNASAEIGYWVRPDRQGEGLATEAAAALLTSAFQDWGFRRVRLRCLAANEASRRVAEKLGLRLEGRLGRSRWRAGHGWSDELVYAVLAEEWDAAAGHGPIPHPPGAAGAKAYAASDPNIAPYVHELLEPEDAVLGAIRQASDAEGLPPIAVGPFDGRHLEVIARATGARRMVEIGTLGGYSAACLARALPADGALHTFELEARHADVARASLDAAGLGERVHIHVGPALERLKDIESEGPFDLVFIDADKASYPAYLAWAEAHLRPGGVVLADNVFRKPRGREAAAPVHALNERLATSEHWRATLLPLEDGLALAVRR